MPEFKTFLYANLGLTHTVALDGLCRAAVMKREGKGKKLDVQPHEFASLLSVLLRGSFLERAILAFVIMDIDGDDSLRVNVEFAVLLQNSFDFRIAASNYEVDPTEPYRDAIQVLAKKTGALMDRALTLPAFIKVCSQEPWLVEALLSWLPCDLDNSAFQRLFSQNSQLPSLEMPPKLSKINLRNVIASRTLRKLTSGSFQ
ncbi:hypothetical protein AAHC03_01380 [Spirometra sp. Aus1]|nr:unnamed protein product [Spirometra erinaceieuropaei]